MHGELKDLVPKRFAGLSSASTHPFVILSPAHHFSTHCECSWCATRDAGRIAGCRIRQGNRTLSLFIPVHTEPSIGSALWDLASLPRNGYRPAKYLDLYKIREGLGGNVCLDHTALRHALAHATGALTRPATVQRLLALFGSPLVNLDSAAHERVFWRCFGQLLVDVDVVLGERL